MEPAWVRDAIFWHLYPLGALGAPDTLTEADPERGSDGIAHRLPRLLPWLDHLVSIGCNGLLLGPVFTAASHGYDTLDHFTIDPRLGDEADMQALIDACHERGIRVGFDGVFNHVGRDHELAKGRLDDPATTYFEGHSGLVNLDFNDPRSAELVTRVLQYWSERGVDCWRLDAAYAMNASIWREILPPIRQQFPQLYIFGEVIHGDYPAIVAAADFDAVTQYELWKAVWSSLNDANFFELAHALARHAEFCQSFTPQTFLSNHDVTRIATQLTCAENLPLAVALLAFLPGTPSIYYGDEDGFTGTKYERLGGDAEIRPPLPETPVQLSELGRPVRAMYQELLGERRRRRWLHDAELSTSDLTNTTVAIHLRARTGEAGCTLALNCGQELAQIAGRTVAAHDVAWWDHDA